MMLICLVKAYIGFNYRWMARFGGFWRFLARFDIGFGRAPGIQTGSGVGNGIAGVKSLLKLYYFFTRLENFLCSHLPNHHNFDLFFICKDQWHSTGVF